MRSRQLRRGTQKQFEPSRQCGALHMHYRVRVRAAGGGPIKGMPVLSAARQNDSSSGLGAVTKVCRRGLNFYPPGAGCEQAHAGREDMSQP
eukprot:358826-Chlamydomonas_euryale.AAC.2